MCAQDLPAPLHIFLFPPARVRVVRFVLAGFGMPAQLSHAPSANFRTACTDHLGLVLRQMTVFVFLAQLTCNKSLLLSMAFSLRHKISLAAVDDLLGLLRIHCPTVNSVVPNIVQFQEIFRKINHPIE